MSVGKPTRGGWVVAALFALAPPLAAAGGLALAGFGALAGFLSARLVRPARTAPLVMFALFVLWAMTSALWSPANGALAAAKLFGGVATGIMLAVAARGERVVRAAGLASVLVLAGLLLIEALFSLPLSHLAHPGDLDWRLARNPSRGASFLLLLLGAAVAAALALKPRWIGQLLAASAAALSAFLAFQFDANANVLALAAGLTAALAAFAAPRLTLRTLGFTLAAALLTAPLVASQLPATGDTRLPYSWSDRLTIWRSAAARIEQAPLLGHGLDAARAMDTPIEIGSATYPRIPLHPHNAALQIWLETGAAGAVLGAAALALSGLALARWLRHRRDAALAAWTITAYATLSNVSFGIWQEWWIAAGFIAAALAAALITAPRAANAEALLDR